MHTNTVFVRRYIKNIRLRVHVLMSKSDSDDLALFSPSYTHTVSHTHVRRCSAVSFGDIWLIGLLSKLVAGKKAVRIFFCCCYSMLLVVVVDFHMKFDIINGINRLNTYLSIYLSDLSIEILNDVKSNAQL